MPENPSAARLTRLEEALLFSERRVDELSDHVLALGNRIDALAARLAAVERLLAPGPEAPAESPDHEEP